MKRFAILLFLLLALLTACAAEPETPLIRNGFVAEGGVLKYYKDDLPLTFSAGVQTIEGKPYYVEADGVSISALTDCLAEKDGQLLYFTEDSSLMQFQAGFVNVDGGLYYAAEDGCSLLTAREEIVRLGEILCAFDEDCRVMSFSAGVQEIFGNLYYVSEGGAAIACPPEGPLLTADALYCANADGSLATDYDCGYLHFGPDGRYTSGIESLDRQVEELLALAQVTGTDPLEDFRLCYEYLRDHCTYLGMTHYYPGTVDWAADSAAFLFEYGKGNCYCWAAAQMYCARRLGLQASVVAGWENNYANDHAWMMAEMDGEEYLFDAELEYARNDIYGTGPIDMFRVAPEDGVYNGLYYFFPEEP